MRPQLAIQLDVPVTATQQQVWSVLSRAAEWWDRETVLDLTLGGRFREVRAEPGGARRIEVAGVVWRMREQHEASFTWYDTAHSVETQVTFHLMPQLAGTNLMLRHARFERYAHEVDGPFEQAAWHLIGWWELMARMAAYAGRAELLPGAITLRIIVEQIVPTTPERLWALFADEAGWRRWFGDVELVEPRVGGAYRARYVGDDVERVTTGEFTAVEPMRHIAWSWREDEWSAPTDVQIMFEACTFGPLAEPATRVHLVHSHFEGPLAELKPEEQYRILSRYAFGWCEKTAAFEALV